MNRWNRVNLALSTMILLSTAIWLKVVLYVLHDYFDYTILSRITHYCPEFLHLFRGSRPLFRTGINVLLLICSLWTLWRLTLEIRKSIEYHQVLKANSDKLWSSYMRSRYKDWKWEIRVIDSPERFAFTSGYLRPKTVISKSLLLQLEEKEVDAVMLRQQYQCSRYNPLRSLVGWLIQESLSFIPIHRSMFRYARIWMELQADQYALSHSRSSDERIKMALLKCEAPREAMVYRLRQFSHPHASTRVPLLTVGSSLQTVLMALLFMLGATAC